MKVTANPWRVRNAAVLLSGALTMGLAGCGGSEDDGPAPGSEPTVKVNTAAEIAQESAADYSQNENGIITGSTLQSWIDNWSANRPAGITGDLVVLQVAPGYRDDIKFVKPNEAGGVRVYSVPGSSWVMSRSNGVTETISMVLDGPHMDALMQYYDIDPSKDMVVFASGTGGGFQNMLMGRGWYLFRYWGAPAEHLAVLNGSIAHALNPMYLGNATSTPPGTGTATVKDLMDDNTALQVTLGELLQAAKTSDPNVFIWDARSAGEYNGLPNKTGGATGNSCGDADGDGIADADYNGNGSIDAGDRRCYTAFEGHPAGAVNLEYTQMLVTDDGAMDYDGDGSMDASYSYKDKSTIASLIDGAGYADGQTIYTYCRTTYRAMVTGLAAGVVMGYPVRFYDGAMIEWLQMANWANQTGSVNLPETSPWRSDLVSASVFSQYNDPAVVEQPTIVDPYAATSDVIVAADRAYKAGGSSGDGGSDGGSGSGGGAPSLPANPCGG